MRPHMGRQGNIAKDLIGRFMACSHLSAIHKTQRNMHNIRVKSFTVDVTFFQGLLSGSRRVDKMFIGLYWKQERKPEM